MFTRLVACESTPYLSPRVIFGNNCLQSDVVAATLTDLCLPLLCVDAENCVGGETRTSHWTSAEVLNLGDWN